MKISGNKFLSLSLFLFVQAHKVVVFLRIVRYLNQMDQQLKFFKSYAKNAVDAILEAHNIQVSKQSNECYTEKTTEILLWYNTLEDHQHSTFHCILVGILKHESKRIKHTKV